MERIGTVAFLFASLDFLLQVSNSGANLFVAVAAKYPHGFVIVVVVYAYSFEHPAATGGITFLACVFLCVCQGVTQYCTCVTKDACASLGCVVTFFGVFTRASANYAEETRRISLSL